MDFGIEGKIALVTAASKGLGRASAEELSREGCRLAICSRNEAEIAQVAKEIAEATGNEVVPFVADVSQADQIDALLTGVREKLGDPDIVVVNAGGPKSGRYADIGLEDYPVAVELTMMSGVRLTHATLPAMRAKGWGRIVFISSISVKQPIPNLLLSNMTRAGLTGFIKTVASEVAASGVTLNQVLPGAHDTDRVRSNAAQEAQTKGLAVEEVLTHRAQTTPMKRLGEPRELAALVTFLASARSSFITGTSTVVDGGSFSGLM